MLKKTFKLSIPLFVIGMGLLVSELLYATKTTPVKLPPENIIPQADVAMVEQSPRQIIISSQGQVTAKNTLSLVSQVTGKIVAMHPEFADGGAINANDVIIQIEDIDYQLALIRAQATVANAQLEVEERAADKRVAETQLSGKGHSSLALKIPQKVLAEANLAAAKAELQQAKLNFNRTRVTLPYGSRVKQRLVGLNQYVVPGTELATLYSTDVAQVKISITDQQLALLDLPLGYSAAADDEPIPVTLSAILAQKTRYWQGRLVRLDAALDTDTQLIQGYVEIEQPYQLRPELGQTMPLAVGQYVKAEIIPLIQTSVLVIPDQALRAGGRVYVITDNKLDIRTVDILHREDDQVLLNSGVSAGEKVAISPMHRAVQGMKVNINPTATATVASTTEAGKS
ncbi:efflux RND transporter periplasmic adaptor subunit [Rheinheimera baltica]|uniref:efflux RND transporter periplasmic adaptor subunit n=1 Tax=Rheinheimera baltica TaxID=67576 RepID=UPI00273E3D7F|nr:efflux RND transporter periplasmic adaptor subunit [Rheinheimera baltica]MDP5142585.1 efflux RND transporter periplasmic adaptor subunit [Rheinheimera baltica]